MNLDDIIKKIFEEYNNSFVIIAITALYNKTSILEEKYCLQKEALGDIIVLGAPPLVDKRYNIEDARKQRPFSQEQINNFVSKMEDSISKDNLLIMYNNLHNLKIKESDITLIMITFIYRILLGIKKGAVGGFYSTRKNKIVVYSQKGDALMRKIFKSKSKLTKESEITLEGEYTHELLHMSSTIRKKNKSCSGFMHYYRAPYVNFCIGRGINEGYTDLLNDRIFNAKNNGGLYEIYKITSELIENLIGKDRMMHLYFTADLKGLISELSKYIKPNQVKEFIMSLDLMSKNPNKINEVIEYLFKLYNIKIHSEVVNGQITNEMADALYNEFKSKIIRLSEVFNEWFETKSEITTKSFIDIKSFIEEQQDPLPRLRDKL